MYKQYTDTPEKNVITNIFPDLKFLPVDSVPPIELCEQFADVRSDVNRYSNYIGL